MHALQVDAATADARLAEAGGVIRKVVPHAPPPVAAPDA